MNLKALEQSARVVTDACGTCHPLCAVVLGSGWSDAVGDIPARARVAYEAIPCLGQTTVTGHRGELIVAEIGDGTALLFLGRRHWYEGQGWEPVAFPVYTCMKLDVSMLLLTNAAGGIRPDLQPGDLMVIEDHINAMGANPLVGPHDPTWGPRFPDMSQVYDKDLQSFLRKCGEDTGTSLAGGIYLAASGPTYETPAEIGAYRGWGADAVGMSTVPEAVLAHSAGLRVAGLSCITNRAAQVGGSQLSHDEVVAVTEATRPRMKRLLLEFLARLNAGGAAATNP